MTLEEFADIQKLTPEQSELLKTVAIKLEKAGVIVNADHLYKALAADKAYLTVQAAAKVLDISAHMIRSLGKSGELKIDGRKRAHRVNYKSLLEYLRTRGESN